MFSSRYLILCVMQLLLLSFQDYSEAQGSSISFTCDSEQCLNQPVEYQCTVTGSGTNILTWRVYTDNGTQIGSDVVYVSTSNNQASDTIGGVFTVERISTSPLISNISFTVQSSINGYTISCEDGSELINKTCIISIKGTFPPPSVDPISVDSSINIEWTPPNITSQCVTVSSYSITSNATNSIITTTDTSVDIPLAGLSPGVHCVSVATVDTANRTGEYSHEECILLGEPSVPVITWSINKNYLSIILYWTFPQPIIPPLLYVYIYYTNSPDGQSQLIPLLPNVTNYTIPLITNTTYYYNISVYGHNILGNGSITIIPVHSPIPNKAMTSSIITPSIFIVAPTTTSSDSSGVDLLVIVGPIVVFMIMLLWLALLIGFICLCVLWRRNSRQGGTDIKFHNAVSGKGRTAETVKNDEVKEDEIKFSENTAYLPSNSIQQLMREPVKVQKNTSYCTNDLLKSNNKETWTEIKVSENSAYLPGSSIQKLMQEPVEVQKNTSYCMNDLKSQQLQPAVHEEDSEYI